MKTRAPSLAIPVAVLLALICTPLDADPAGPPQPAPRFVEDTLSAVARLRPANRSAGGCTAVLIAPGAALTAAHCARGATEGRAAMQLVFRPGRGDGAVRITVRSVAFHARAPARVTTETAFADLAYLRLARDVPADVATPIPVAGAEARSTRTAEAAIWGYVNGSDDILHGHAQCALRHIRPAVLGSDCTVVTGQSGSPVLLGGDGDWQVQGIAVARVEGPEVRALIADLVPWPDFGTAGPDAPPQ